MAAKYVVQISCSLGNLLKSNLCQFCLRVYSLELLATNPLAYLIVDDLGYTYGIGLDKGSKEFLMAMSKMVASHEYVVSCAKIIKYIIHRVDIFALLLDCT